jgi:hypothetical protein
MFTIGNRGKGLAATGNEWSTVRRALLRASTHGSSGFGDQWRQSGTTTATVPPEPDCCDGRRYGRQPRGILSIYPHLSVNQKAAAALTYEGRIPLAIGVELMELVYGKAGRKIFLKVMPDAEKIRAPEKLPCSFIGDERTGEIFIKMI